MKRNKKDGYVLAIVMILTLVMAITITSAFTIIMRYLLMAKNDLENLGDSNAIYYSDNIEVYTNV